MSDYINREMAVDCIVLECDDVTLEQARQAIKDCPSADVVKVVRCKDCIYNDRGWCGAQEYGTRHIEDNDYCSYGERKEQEHDT